MVKKPLLAVAFSAIIVVLILAGTPAQAQRTYHINQENTKIWINDNGTIDLFYNLSLTLDSGTQISSVTIGQPTRDFTIGQATDQGGNNLTTFDASYNDQYLVNVTLHTPLQAGQTVWFTLITNIAGMISADTTNPGNLGMLFTPMWWNQAQVNDLRISIVMPPNVTKEDVKTTESLWNSTSVEDGRLVIFWEKTNLAPTNRFTVGVSFPAKYLPNFQAGPTGPAAFFLQYGPFVLLAAVLIVGIIIVIALARKRAYLTPTISMESLGIRHGLTAVEASYLLDTNPKKTVTEILYSLLQKRAVWAESANPAIKLRIMKPFQDKKGTPNTPLRYYEIDFLDSLKQDGTLDEEKLAQTIMFLRDTVEEKLRGYSRKDTIDYYKKTVAKAWNQVEKAGTPEVASNAYDEQLLWLLLDPNYKSRTELAFQNRVFTPNPLWLWYWYGYQNYNPNPAYKPNIETPTQAPKPPTIPGADFANNIATAVENTSNNIVVNLEKFANSILPASTAKASSQPAHHDAECVCACAACACACACVSCACACAGGGVG
jgi:hypothetical protein